MTSAVSQLVYMSNFRAIGQSVWEKNGNRQTDRKKETQKHRNTDLNFIKIDNIDGHFNGVQRDAEECDQMCYNVVNRLSLYFERRF